jgi:hypothetical protein
MYTLLICFLLKKILAKENSFSGVIKSEETSLFYESLERCGIDGVTYENKDAAHNKGQSILHCQKCGKCSNMNDFNVYKNMSQNLTETTRFCAYLSIFGKRRVDKCMKSRVNLTADCQKCWVDNIFCTAKHCRRICLKEQISPIHNASETSKCLECDEKFCGPAFIECAGMNRRRAGIATDISREESQVCQDVDVG